MRPALAANRLPDCSISYMTRAIETGLAMLILLQKDDNLTTVAESLDACGDGDADGVFQCRPPVRLPRRREGFGHGPLHRGIVNPESPWRVRSGGCSLFPRRQRIPGQSPVARFVGGTGLVHRFQMNRPYRAFVPSPTERSPPSPLRPRSTRVEYPYASPAPPPRPRYASSPPHRGRGQSWRYPGEGRARGWCWRRFP